MENTSSLLVIVVAMVAMVAGVVVGFILKQMLTAKEITSSKKLMARIAEEIGRAHV